MLVVPTVTFRVPQVLAESQTVMIAVPGAVPVMVTELLLMVATKAMGLELEERL